jgi:pimeloyl-ACP methyl ester carboxylesterase
MRRDGAVDGFRLAYERTGSGRETAVLLLHGWPGDRTDSRSRRPDRRPRDGALAVSRPAVPRAVTDRIGDFFASATLTKLDGAGHFTPLERPREFAAAIEDAVGPGF